MVEMLYLWQYSNRSYCLDERNVIFDIKSIMRSDKVPTVTYDRRSKYQSEVQNSSD